MILPMMVGATVLLNSLQLGLSPLPFEEPKQPVPQQFVTVKSQYEIELDEKKREEALKLKEKLEWHQGLATAYWNGKDEMNGELGITANGYDLDNGYIYKGYRILASDKQYSFGTLIDIKLHDGTLIHGIVLDRGGAIRGSGRFDIVFSDDASCREFGRQSITFKVIRKGW